MAAFTANQISINTGDKLAVINSGENPAQVNKGDFLVVKMQEIMPVEISGVLATDSGGFIIELLNPWGYENINNAPATVIPSTIKFQSIMKVLQDANTLFNNNTQAMHDWQTKQGNVTFSNLDGTNVEVKTLSTIIDDLLSLFVSHNDTRELNAPGGHDSIYKRNFNNVAQMKAYTAHKLGNKYSTGKTIWKVVAAATPYPTDNGLYLRALGDVNVSDFLEPPTELWQYENPITVPNNLAQYQVFAGESQNENIEIGKTYTVRYAVSESATGTEDVRVRIGGDSKQLQSGSGEYEVTAVSQRCTIDTARGDDGSAGAVISISITEKTEYGAIIKQANDYCQHENTRNRLVFPENSEYIFNENDSFEIFVEGGGWYCRGICKLKWSAAPLAGFAIKVRGRYAYSDNYQRLVEESNNIPLEGFTIGEYGNMVAGSGLQLGHANARQSADGVVVTSKFKIRRVNVFDFDDVIDFWNGVWACELEKVNTMGGSWRTPRYFGGLDFGENIKLSHCFIADNHQRTDGTMGVVHFEAGSYNIHGGSFDNMRVKVDGDADVRMYGPHFENPVSTAKNKRFLEVIGSHAWCVINEPRIVIRNTNIYSTLFYCKAATAGDPHPQAGGLKLNNPHFSAAEKYRPDLALVKSAEDNFSYEGDGYLELVGGGGKVFCDTAAMNSLYYSGLAIPISKSLAGGLRNYDYQQNEIGDSPNGWQSIKEGTHLGVIEVTDDHYWVGDRSLKMQAWHNGGSTFYSTKLMQKIPCQGGQLVLGSIMRKYQFILENGANGPVSGEVTSQLDFYDNQGVVIGVLAFKGGAVTSDSQSEHNGWELLRHFGVAPAGTVEVALTLNTFSTSDSEDKKLTSYWDAAILNAV
ncbi:MULTISPECIES: hypothetical protein [unclassified Pseudoalteromonas]|uniref:hypothetical protein n=1 Tax=unclassified Pseudoalteromonas TaxID=194690 RepID=UPI0015F869B1|nr:MULTISPECIES: hypothetical protein [unclassified Pseudoalteromonas]MBB1291022.1 hypothetical protein [Pseudoalteromonas sp. SR41-5]MBB1415352.1 hypothetical protein [Pseudoalteromonas sp. SG43-8]